MTGCLAPCDNTSYQAGQPINIIKTYVADSNPTVGETSDGIGKSGSLKEAIVLGNQQSPGNQQSHGIIFSDPTTTRNTLRGAIRK
jgi:hypothetical protein